MANTTGRFKDREGANLQRRRIQIVSQSPSEIIADIYRHDIPTEEGTPLTADTLNAWDNKIAEIDAFDERIGALEGDAGATLVTDIVADPERPGWGIKTFNNGLSCPVQFVPADSEATPSANRPPICFTESDFTTAADGTFQLAFGPSATCYANSEFIAQLEMKEANGGYTTLMDSIFKGTDGSVLVSDVVEPYAGRIMFGADPVSGGGIGGISEAPIDGKQYARKNAGWEEVQGGTGGGVTMEEVEGYVEDDVLGYKLVEPAGSVLIDMSGSEETDGIKVFPLSAFDLPERDVKATFEMDNEEVTLDLTFFANGFADFAGACPCWFFMNGSGAGIFKGYNFLTDDNDHNVWSVLLAPSDTLVSWTDFAVPKISEKIESKASLARLEALAFGASIDSSSSDKFNGKELLRPAPDDLGNTELVLQENELWLPFMPIVFEVKIGNETYSGIGKFRNESLMPTWRLDSYTIPGAPNFEVGISYIMTGMNGSGAWYIGFGSVAESITVSWDKTAIRPLQLARQIGILKSFQINPDEWVNGEYIVVDDRFIDMKYFELLQELGYNSSTITLTLERKTIAGYPVIKCPDPVSPPTYSVYGAIKAYEHMN